MNKLDILSMAVGMAFCLDTDTGHSPALEELQDAGCDARLLGVAAEVYGTSHEEIFMAFRRDQRLFASQVNREAAKCGVVERMPEVMA